MRDAGNKQEVVVIDPEHNSSAKPGYSPERVTTHDHAHARIKGYLKQEGCQVFNYCDAAGE